MPRTPPPTRPRHESSSFGREHGSTEINFGRTRGGICTARSYVEAKDEPAFGQ